MSINVDITVTVAIDDAKSVLPDKPVNVTISYNEDQQKDLKVDEKKNVRVIHFAENQVTGEITAELPHTGCIGTTIFYILGTVLTLGSAVFFVARRRTRRI